MADLRWSTDLPTAWDGDHDAVRALWSLDPALAYVNHGSFGATPLPAQIHQQQLRDELERDPVSFLADTWQQRIEAVRVRLADFLHADPEGLVFVANATTGMQTVLNSLLLARHDHVVVTDHAYGAIRQQLHRLWRDFGVDVEVHHLPLPESGPAELAASVLEAVTEETRLLVLDHVASLTGLIMPVKEIAAVCRERGVIVVVDGAHAPGMLDVDIASLGVDAYVGNLHKWVCAPKGAAALWLDPALRERVSPLVTSHGYRQGLHAEFDWTGTFDPTSLLSAPAALDTLTGLGWDKIRSYGHSLARYGAAICTDALGTAAFVPDRQDLYGQMALVDLGRHLGIEASDRLHRELREQHLIQVPVVTWDDRTFVRVSAQAYNQPADYERLAAALPKVLASR